MTHVGYLPDDDAVMAAARAWLRGAGAGAPDSVRDAIRDAAYVGQDGAAFGLIDARDVVGVAIVGDILADAAALDLTDALDLDADVLAVAA